MIHSCTGDRSCREIRLESVSDIQVRDDDSLEKGFSRVADKLWDSGNLGSWLEQYTDQYGDMGVREWRRMTSFEGEGNGNPLQCSCLENPRDWSHLAAAAAAAVLDR